MLEAVSSAFSSPAVAARLKETAPTSFDAAASFWKSAVAEGALSNRMKELIQVALHATATSLNADGARRHIRRALTAGATETDVLDVLMTIVGVSNHALYSGIPILMRELKQLGHPEAELPEMTPQAQKVKEEFIQARGFWNEQRDVIARTMPEYFSSLTKVSTDSWQNGSLSNKERELVCIAIDVTVTHMYEPGLVIHIRHALEQGASRAEILEVFQLAALTGLEGFLIGAESLFGHRCE